MFNINMNVALVDTFIPENVRNNINDDRRKLKYQ